MSCCWWMWVEQMWTSHVDLSKGDLKKFGGSVRELGM